jgi:transmembrane sensor
VDKRQSRLLLRVLAGEASRDEESELQSWIDADPANARSADSLRAVWAAAGHHRDRSDPAAAWTRLAERTRLAGSPIRRIDSAPSTRRTRWGGLRIAAMVLIALGVATLGRPAARLVDDHVLHRTVTTGKGERVQLVLEDGSRVMLGVESRLRFPRRFSGRTRDVRLQGAAYFEVAHDVTRPFTVFTGDAVTRVLGTRFTVRDYPGAEPARVAVTEGRVAVRAVAAAPQDAGVLLTRGQAAEVAERRVVMEATNQARDLAWTQGTLAFHNAPVREVVAEIGRWYEVDLRVATPGLADRHLTIAFDDEPLETILQEISAVLGARVERRGRVLYLTPVSSPRREPPTADVRNGSL